MRQGKPGNDVGTIRDLLYPLNGPCLLESFVTGQGRASGSFPYFLGSQHKLSWLRISVLLFLWLMVLMLTCIMGVSRQAYKDTCGSKSWILLVV